MKTAAIIPARGGSKGIKNKNIVHLAGRPLIYYALQTCFETDEIDTVIVSTDSENIAKTVLKQFPDVVIINRPKNISGDSSTSEEVILHAIGELEKDNENIENIVFVQATSPLTSSLDISNLLKLLINHDSAGFYIDDYGFFESQHDLTVPRLPRQERIPLKREVGNAWAFDKEMFKKNKCRLFGNYALCKIERPKDLEIDDYDDLLLIDCILKTSQCDDN